MSKHEQAGGDTTVREAGHKGGEARKEELGPKGYSELGKKGGHRVHDLVNEGKQAEKQGRDD